MFDLDALSAAVAAHGRVARVVIAEVAGSAPREVGAAMLVWEGGQSGTIGGGALEYQAAEASRKQRALVTATRHPLGPQLGQCCGGAVTLVSEVFDHTRLATLSAETALLRRIEGQESRPLAFDRLLRGARNAGDIVPTLYQNGWLIEPMQHPRTSLWIWGAGHVGRALVETLTALPNFDITWVDTNERRFPESIPGKITQLVAAEPASLVPYAPSDGRHLILTYSHALDLELCHQLLNHGFEFAGLIGSKTKWTRFQSRLAALGHSPAQIARINCPIGDPTLGKHPQAIAIGVAQQLLLFSQTTMAQKDRTA